MLEIAYKTGSGSVLPNNEDRILIQGEIIAEGSGVRYCDEGCLVAVCDGVGGAKFGEIAAETACVVLRKYREKYLDKELVCEFINEANQAIATSPRKDKISTRMYTTIVAASIRDRDFYAFNLGDSELQHYREPLLFRLSDLHKLGAERTDVTGGQAHVITRYLGGAFFPPAVYDGRGAFSDTDVLLLFSDGVGDVMQKQELLQLLRSGLSAEELCCSIYEQAIELGSDDNISVLLVRHATDEKTHGKPA